MSEGERERRGIRGRERERDNVTVHFEQVHLLCEISGCLFSVFSLSFLIRGIA